MKGNVAADDVQGTDTSGKQPHLGHHPYTSPCGFGSLANGHGASATYAYDAWSQLTTIPHAFVGGSGPTAGVTFTYTRDQAGRRQSDVVSNSAYLWHPLNTSTNASYTADNDNELQFTNSAYRCGDMTADPNVTNIGGESILGWDAMNRVMTLTNPQHSSSYSYDAFGRRTAKVLDGVSTSYVSDGSREIAEYDTASGVELRHYVHGLGNTPIAEDVIGANGLPSDVDYLHTDGLGSVVAVTNASGAEVTSFTYGPWGETTPTPGEPFRWAGMRYDAENDFYYDHARYYGSTLGRFVSPDPAGTSGGINLFAYAGNDPVNATDVTGLLQDGCDPNTEDCSGNPGAPGGNGGGVAPPQTENVKVTAPLSTDNSASVFSLSSPPPEGIPTQQITVHPPRKNGGGGGYVFGSPQKLGGNLEETGGAIGSAGTILMKVNVPEIQFFGGTLAIIGAGMFGSGYVISRLHY